MKNIKLNNTPHRLYSLEDIRQISENRQKTDNPASPFSYASYSGSLEAHYSMLLEFVERLVKEGDKLELAKEYQRLVENSARDLANASLNGNCI